MRVNLVFIFLLMLSASCTTYYKPNAVHSPMLKQKGDGHVTAAIGGSGTGLGNLQLAYAVTDHFALMTDGMIHYRKGTYQNSSYPDKGTVVTNIYSGNLGVGYFEKFGKSGKQLIQLYGGGGYGKSYSQLFDYNPADRNVSAEFYNVFVQPGIVFTKQSIDFAVDTRINYVSLYNFNGDFEGYYNGSDPIPDGPNVNFMLVEPTFTLKAGGKSIRGHVQGGFAIPVVNADDFANYCIDQFFIDPYFKFNLGISYYFGKKEKSAPGKP